MHLWPLDGLEWDVVAAAAWDLCHAAIECICGYCMVSNGLVSNGLIKIPRGAAMADASTEFVYGHWMVSNGLSLPLLGLVPRIECVCGHWMVLNGLVGTAVTAGATAGTVASTECVCGHWMVSKGPQ